MSCLPAFVKDMLAPTPFGHDFQWGTPPQEWLVDMNPHLISAKGSLIHSFAPVVLVPRQRGGAVQL